MKKIILPFLLCIAVFAVQAQNKITKTSIVAKWELAALNIEGLLFYDVEKDSIALSGEIITQLAAAGQDSAGAAEMMKGQFGAMKEIVFEFNADGSYSISGSPDGKGTELGTYEVDETKGTLTMKGKKTGEEKQVITATFKNNRLLLDMGEKNGKKTILEFNKGK